MWVASQAPSLFCGSALCAIRAEEIRKLGVWGGREGKEEFLRTRHFLIPSSPIGTPSISSFPCALGEHSEPSPQGLRELMVSTQAPTSQGAGGCGGEAQRRTPDISWGNPGWLPVGNGLRPPPFLLTIPPQF